MYQVVIAVALSLAAMASPVLADVGHGKKEGAGAPGHATSVGEPGDPGAGTRSVTVDMSDDMRFRPSKITVKQGETIRFVARNVGQGKHELMLGTPAELKVHADLMRKFPEMEHDDANAVTVDPGKTGALIWKFTRAGEVMFGCLMPGHFELGMVGTIVVNRTLARK